MPYIVNPIGTVQKTDNENYLVIREDFWDATTHLELFSHIIILWWIDGMDTPEKRSITLANPPRGKGPIPSGVFACRSPARPNPIGHTISKILEIQTKKHRIRVDHIDANDMTPILDIKPYLPSSDRVDDAQVAPWFVDLETRYTK
ncbi:MAG: tRNA (N6-threonylcarbamoyladenosine(37)-N6)-methyltransferase TrmO [Candidatus Thorarchaeota archaeon]|nr:tRNA (N6-threonylcarbamoyladenosine(37)-N6)-methyltransferase TrmO [Candidatus Thorarchaeota archaeon]